MNVRFGSEGVNQVSNDARKLGGVIDNVAGKTSSFWKTASSTAFGFLAANVFGKVAQGFSQVAGAGLNFEAQMSAIQAVTGATGEEFKSLSDLALQIGKDTSFGATEAALAIEELAKAGISVENILGGAADATTALAAAGGVDLASAATVMSNAMNQFGIAGTDAARVADVLAAASGISSTGVLELGESLKYVGTSANALGYDIETITTALAIMADQGMVGSMAGTSLNTMLLSMANPTQRAREEMTALGLSFTDMNGNMKPLEQIINDVAMATAGMGDAQRAAALEIMFGVEGGRAMNALLNTQSEAAKEAGKSWTDYYAGVTESGAAADQAAARMNNFNGDMDALKGSIETAVIMITMTFLPSLRGIVQAGSGAVNMIVTMVGAFASLRDDGVPPLQALKQAISDTFGPGVGAVIGVFINGIVGAVGGIRTAFSGIGAVLAPVAGFVSDLVSTFTALITPTKVWTDGANKAFPMVRKNVEVIGSAMKVLPAIVEAIRRVIEKTFGARGVGYFNTFTKVVATIADVVGRVAGVLRDVLGTALEFVGRHMGTIGPLIAGAVAGFLAFTAAAAGMGAIAGIVGGITAAIALLLSPIGLVVVAFAALFLAYQKNFLGFADGVNAVAKIALQAFNSIVDGIQALKAAFDTGGWAAVWDTITDSFQSVDWRGLAVQAGHLIMDGLRGLASGAGNLFGWISDALQNALQDLSAAFQVGMQLAWNQISSIDWGDFIQDLAWDAFVLALEWGDWIGGKIADFGSWLGAKVTDIPWSTIIGAIGDFGAWLLGNVPAIASFAWTGIIQPLGNFGLWLLSHVPAIASFAWSGLVQGMGSLGDWLKANVPSIASFAWSGLIIGLGNFGDWLKANVPSIASFAWSGLITGLGNFGTWLLANVPSIASFAWSGIIQGLGNFGTWLLGNVPAISSFAWTGIIKPLGNFGAWLLSNVPVIASFAWTGIIKPLGNFGVWLLSKVPAIASFAWSGLVQGMGNLGTWLLKNVPTISSFAWSGLVQGMGNLGDWLLAKVPAIASFAWSGLIQSMGNLGDWLIEKVPEILSFPSWPDMPSAGDIAGWFKDAILSKVGFGDDGPAESGLPEGSGGRATGAKGGTQKKTDLSGFFGGGGIGQSIPAPDISGVLAALETMKAAYTTADVHVAASTGLMVGSVMANAGAMVGSIVANTGLMLGTIVANTGAMVGNVAGSHGAMTATVSGSWSRIQGSAQSAASGMASNVSAQFSRMQGVSQSSTQAMAAVVGSNSIRMQGTTSSAFSQMSASASNNFSRMSSSASSNFSQISARAASSSSQLVSSFRAAGANAASALQGSLSRLPGIVSNAGAGAAGRAHGVGANIGAGFAAGILSQAGRIAGAAAAVVLRAISAANASAHVQSPSKDTQRTGQYMGMGWMLGILDLEKDIAAAARSVVTGAIDAGNGMTGSGAWNPALATYGSAYASAAPSAAMTSQSRTPAITNHITVQMSRDDMVDFFGTIDAMKTLTNPDELRAIMGDI